VLIKKFIFLIASERGGNSSAPCAEDAWFNSRRSNLFFIFTKMKDKEKTLAEDDIYPVTETRTKRFGNHPIDKRMFNIKHGGNIKDINEGLIKKRVK
jgi:hypothetical protein